MAAGVPHGRSCGTLRSVQVLLGCVDASPRFIASSEVDRSSHKRLGDLRVVRIMVASPGCRSTLRRDQAVNESKGFPGRGGIQIRAEKLLARQCPAIGAGERRNKKRRLPIQAMVALVLSRVSARPCTLTPVLTSTLHDSGCGPGSPSLLQACWDTTPVITAKKIGIESS